MLDRTQIDFLLTSAYNAAIVAGAKVMDIYNCGGDFSVNIKSDNTPITLADKEAHQAIKTMLSYTRIPLLSEEGRDVLYEERCGWDLFWLVDPLDGTKEFIKRNGEFTINIALMVDNMPYIGVVYVPNTRKIYFNDPQTGSFMKENVVPEVTVSNTIEQVLDGGIQLPLNKSINKPIRVGVSRSHISPETSDYVNLLRENHPDLEVVTQGSSLKLCMIAEGSLDVYPRTTPTLEWDTAAGECIMNGAGATITDIETEERFIYNKEELTNPFFICRSKFFDK